jgi:hypothetical protein
MTTVPAPNTTEAATTLRGTFLEVFEFRADQPGPVTTTDIVYRNLDLTYAT